MLSSLYHEHSAPPDDALNRSKGVKNRLGDQLDEIAVFALVAVVVLYVAAASFWFVF
ncbi:MAG TPA: hypothetical protein VE243_03400 [Candidatus Acidoferrum sp.]|nr:hypothetical protein [Candidatus Acidoferrum sp.]